MQFHFLYFIVFILKSLPTNFKLKLINSHIIAKCSLFPILFYLHVLNFIYGYKHLLQLPNFFITYYFFVQKINKPIIRLLLVEDKNQTEYYFS